MMRNKKILVVILSMVIIGETTAIKPYAKTNNNISFKEAYKVTTNGALENYENVSNEAEILSEFNKYINGGAIEEGQENYLKNKEVLNLLYKHMKQLTMPEEFYVEWKERELIEYAASVRSMIKAQKENIKSIQQLQSYLDLSKGTMLVKLEARKFKAHPESNSFQTCYMRINRDDKDIDITDLVIARTSELKKETKVDILSVGQRRGKAFIKNPDFEIQNKDGAQRIILKNVTREILTNELRVNIEVNYLENKTNTDLNIRVLPYVDKQSDVLVDFNKYINGPAVQSTNEKDRLDRAVLVLLERYKEELMLAEEFYQGTWDEYEKLQYAGSVRSFVKGVKENIKSLDQLQKLVDISKGSCLVCLESAKFKAHPDNKSFKLCNIKVNKSDKDIDITDKVMAISKELNPETAVKILEVVEQGNEGYIKNPNFEIKDINGSQRIILKSVDNNVINKELRISIYLTYMNYGTFTHLMFKLI